MGTKSFFMHQRQKVLVSGASRGMGAETAVAVAQLGGDLILTARNEEGLAKTAARIERLGLGTQVHLCPGNLVLNTFCEELSGRVDDLGGIDALLLNAAQVEPIGPLDRTEDSTWTEAIELNLLAPSRLARRLLPGLVKNRGRLITVGTGASTSPIPSWSAYCASKAALLMLTRVLAAEYPEVTSLSISPGVVDTVMQRTIRERHQLMPSQLADYFQGLHAQGQLVHPQVPGRVLAWVALYAQSSWSGTELNAADPALMDKVSEAFEAVSTP